MSRLYCDLGGGNIKCSKSNSDQILIVPSMTGRPKKEIQVLIGLDLLDEGLQHGEFIYTRICDRGYLTNFEVAEAILDKTFVAIGGISDIQAIVVSIPPFMPKELLTALESMLMNHFRFKNIIKTCPAAAISLHVKMKQPICLVVDSGFSFTHIIPVVEGHVIQEGIVRIDIGGKLLTNYLKELLSYGQINVMDETVNVNLIKEEVCYVSLDFEEDMAQFTLLKNQSVLPRQERLSRDERVEMESRLFIKYVLPDYSKIKKGYRLAPNVDLEELAPIRNQIVSLSSETILVPELLFHPRLIGMNQAGIPEAIEQSISNCPVQLQRLLQQNVILTGGNTKFLNFRERVAKELGETYSVTQVEDPVSDPCRFMRHVP